MSGLPTYYAQQMLNLHTRFGLSENARSLLRAHDDWKLGRISQDELGRIIKTSANMRQAIIDTITKVNNIMKKKPEEQKMCLDIIQACAEMLTALEKPAEIKGFPLMKLPVEIRRMVYGWYINAKIAKRAGAVAHPRILPKAPGCHCPQFVASTPPGHQFDLALARTDKKVRDEFLEYFYQAFRFHFPCGCELTRRFLNNDIMRKNLRNVKIHWSGTKSDEAFLLLARCPKLKELEVVVSKGTSLYLSKRETEMRRYFGAPKPAGRLPDSLGMDELLLIRGIERLTVSHTPLKVAARRAEEERASLDGLLQARLKLPRTGL
ncbi:hypothetical protein V8F06_002210 [Rhypophila decipiens]